METNYEFIYKGNGHIDYELISEPLDADENE